MVSEILRNFATVGFFTFGVFTAEVKRVGDVMFGVVTQVVLLRVVQEPKPQTISNILLKVNSKLGGINNLIRGDSQYVDSFLLIY